MDVSGPCFPRFYALLRDFAGPVATIVAASAAVFVTWRLGRAQHRVAADQAKIAQLQADLATVRLQHDLFDRRYEIYEIVFMFIIEIIQRSDMSEEGMRKFVRGMTKAPFLFDQKMTDYFEDLRRQAVYLQEAASFVSDQNNLVGPQRSAAARRRSELFSWFSDEFERLVERFRPFLALDKNTATRAPRPPGRRLYNSEYQQA
jgi:hypothetical protein